MPVRQKQMDDFITIEGVTKRFGKRHALKDVSRTYEIW